MTRTEKIPILLALLPLVAFFPACGSKQGIPQQAAQEISGVAVQTVRRQATPESYAAVGTVKAKITSVLGAKISGTVEKILVKEGDHVRRGQLLAVLDSRTEHAQLAAAAAGIEASSQGMAEVSQSVKAATANREFAEATFKRYKALLAKDSVSRQEFDNAQTQYRAAVAQENAAKAREKQVAAQHQQAVAQHTSAEAVYSYARIVSPINGVVAAKSVDEGTLVMPGTPLLTVEDTGHFRLDANVPVLYLADVHAGQTVPVTIGAQQFEGRVVEIVPAADPNTRTFTAKIEIPASCSCQSGQYGQAEIPVGSANRLLVPASALIRRGQLEGLFVINSKDIAQYQLVKPGKTFGGQVEILSGLSTGDRVAVSNLDRLSDGMRVKTP